MDDSDVGYRHKNQNENKNRVIKAKEPGSKKPPNDRVESANNNRTSECFEIDSAHYPATSLLSFQ